MQLHAICVTVHLSGGIRHEVFAMNVSNRIDRQAPRIVFISQCVLWVSVTAYDKRQ